MSLEIEKMLVLSTGHVSEETANRLPRGHADMAGDDFNESDDIPEWGPAFARAEGWLFRVPRMADNGEPDDLPGTPEDLARVFMFARENGCDWVMLDCDGPQVNTLPFHEW